MSAQIITACEFQALLDRMVDVQVTETTGLIMTRGLDPARGYCLALQPFACGRVTLVWSTDAPEALRPLLLRPARA